MEHLFGPGKEGAGLAGMVADGDDRIEGDVAQLVKVFRAVAGDIDPGLGHDLDGDWVETMNFDPGGPDFDPVALEGPGPAFGHLAAAGVAGAEKEDFQLWVHWRCRSLMSGIEKRLAGTMIALLGIYFVVSPFFQA